MPVNKNALLRFRIIDACLTNRQRAYPTMEQIIEKVETQLGQSISDSLFTKDLKEMKHIYGAPILYSRFHKGYYYDQEGFSIKEFPLTHEEIEALDFSTALLHQLKGTRIFEQFENAINKVIEGYRISKIIGKSENQILQVEEPVKTSGSHLLEPLLKGVVEKTAFLIIYQAFGKEKKEHLFSPYLLKEYRNRWYVIGHAHKSGNIITLALDRIDTIKAEGKYISSENFIPSDFFKYSIGITQLHEAQPQKVVLSVLTSRAPYLISQPIHHSQSILKKTADAIHFSFKIYITTELKMTILSLGSDVEVLEPLSLRAEIIDCARNVSLKYEQGEKK
ncbi:MAG: WYL domain-containing protein [Flavisolibacter sp.]|jgi:predicted DNA-binding transcriptional regulator YafY|nr:WYL domain-containing protein [Flavisolibacter sp.]